MNIRCLIIDDEPLAIKVVETYLEEMDEVELVSSFTNAIEALNYLKSDRVDLIFLV